jgi:hypothetical protein
MVITLATFTVLGFVPLLALIGTIQQRKKMKWERARHAHLMRLARGRR